MSEIDGLGKLRLGIGLLIVVELLTDLVFLVVVEAVLSVLPPSEVLVRGSIYPQLMRKS